MDVSGRLDRWIIRLRDYEFNVVHRLGVKHQAANALSRISTDEEDKTPLEDSIPCLALWDAEEDQHLEGEYVNGYDPCGKFVEPPDMMAIAEEEYEVLSITMEEFLKGRKTDAYCKEALSTVRHITSLLDIDIEGVLMRRALLDGVLQKVVL